LHDIGERGSPAKSAQAFTPSAYESWHG